MPQQTTKLELKAGVRLPKRQLTIQKPPPTPLAAETKKRQWEEEEEDIEPPTPKIIQTWIPCDLEGTGTLQMPPASYPFALAREVFPGKPAQKQKPTKQRYSVQSSEEKNHLFNLLAQFLQKETQNRKTSELTQSMSSEEIAKSSGKKRKRRHYRTSLPSHLLTSEGCSSLRNHQEHTRNRTIERPRVCLCSAGTPFMNEKTVALLQNKVTLAENKPVSADNNTTQQQDSCCSTRTVIIEREQPQRVNRIVTIVLNNYNNQVETEITTPTVNEQKTSSCSEKEITPQRFERERSAPFRIVQQDTSRRPEQSGKNPPSITY